MWQLSRLQALAVAFASTAAAALLVWRLRVAAGRLSARRTVAILVDNGSLVAASFANLRLVAAAFTAHSGVECVPASFRFSDRVDPALLDHRRAVLLPDAVQTVLADPTVARVVILPFFLGPSDTVHVDIAKLADSVSSVAVPVLVAGVLVNMADAADTFVAEALADRVRDVLPTLNARVDADACALPPSRPVHIMLCDHGTPSRAVNAVRGHLATQLSALLQRPVTAASMERRAEAVFDFNEPLLERACAPPLVGDVVVALAFMSPGRHAGTGGDIATILDAAEAANPAITTHMTGVLGAHPRIVAALAERFRRACV